ncbi:MAG: ribosome maturation factor RimP [Coriobacteriia bacterium]|nr:ribosome maturation factor RimP [Coriobacteriia bacterium]
MRSKKEHELLQALETAAAAQGFDLVDLEFTGSGRNALLRIYIDREEGLNLDDVAAANAWISEVVEALDPCKGSYTLEISSPGIDRSLRTWRHFERAVGEEAVIALDGNLVEPVDNEVISKPRLKFTGIISGVNSKQQRITIEAEGVSHVLEFKHIKKARVKGRLDFEGRKDS